MKKLFAILLCLALILSLAACGNENWGIGNYTFTHVHIVGAAEGHCAEVTSWHDNELGVELHTNDIYCSEGTYFLFESGAKCPFCKGE